MLVLQLGHPKIKQDPFPAIDHLRDVFVHLFRAEEESVYLFWHEIPLRFRYHEDLYHNFDDIVALVWLVQRDDQGATKVHFTTQLVSIDWEVRWERDNLVVRGTFAGHDDLYGPYAEALNKQPEVKISKQVFLSEWKTLLHQIIVAFQSGHVEIQDGTERRKWELLQRVERQIPRYGQLYTAVK